MSKTINVKIDGGAEFGDSPWWYQYKQGQTFTVRECKVEDMYDKGVGGEDPKTYYTVSTGSEKGNLILRKHAKIDIDELVKKLKRYCSDYKFGSITHQGFVYIVSDRLSDFILGDLTETERKMLNNKLSKEEKHFLKDLI